MQLCTAAPDGGKQAPTKKLKEDKTKDKKKSNVRHPAGHS